MKKRAYENPARREGVALIIVLAMLTILLALALTLSATTRAERSVVKVHTEMTNTRQLVHAAINRAMVDIQLHDDSYDSFRVSVSQGASPSVDVKVGAYPGRRMYYVNSTNPPPPAPPPPPPDFAPQVGSSHGWLTEQDMNLLHSKESRKFFTYHKDTKAKLAYIEKTGNVWIELDIQGEGNNQYTYIAENHSGGIDLNFAFADPTLGPKDEDRLPRNIGQTPLEINWLPLMNWVDPTITTAKAAYAKETHLHDFVKTMGRVDTVREINRYLLEALDMATPSIPLTPKDLENLEKLSLYCTFSYAPEVAKLDLSGQPGSWPEDADIKAAFQRCHVDPSGGKLSSAELDTLVACLKDYVDEDLAVRDPTLGLGLGSIESVPMVNEIVTTANLNDVIDQLGQVYKYHVSGNYAFELWWPFVEEDPEERSFTFTADVEVTATVRGVGGEEVIDKKITKVSHSVSKGKLSDPFTVVKGSAYVTVETGLGGSDKIPMNNSATDLCINQAHEDAGLHPTFGHHPSNLLERIEVTVKYTGITVTDSDGDIVDLVEDGIQAEFVSSNQILDLGHIDSDRKRVLAPRSNPPSVPSAPPDARPQWAPALYDEQKKPFGMVCREVVDPRFNYAKTQWKIPPERYENFAPKKHLSTERFLCSIDLSGGLGAGADPKVREQVNFLTLKYWAEMPDLDAPDNEWTFTNAPPTTLKKLLQDKIMPLVGNNKSSPVHTSGLGCKRCQRPFPGPFFPEDPEWMEEMEPLIVAASQMHCRNLPEGQEEVGLALVGELGYLPYREWRTLRLLAKSDKVYHRLGEHFMATNELDEVTKFLAYHDLARPRGKVSVNGNYLALASAFYDLPIDLYPGQLSPEPQRFPVDPDPEKRLVRAKLFGLLLTSPANKGNAAFASEWDLGSRYKYRKAIFENPSIVPPNLSEFEVEAFFRNTMGLLTVRNNVFTVMVMVQSLSNLGTPTSTIRAVATVWRDGIPTEGFVMDPNGGGGADRGIHPWFIQNITYLTDYEN
jgi:hypothetical protein